jgi:hypothetical protein
MLISSLLLCFLIPLHVLASRCHLQGVTVSLFISYSSLSVFWVGVGYCCLGVAIWSRWRWHLEAETCRGIDKHYNKLLMSICWISFNWLKNARYNDQDTSVIWLCYERRQNTAHAACPSPSLESHSFGGWVGSRGLSKCRLQERDPYTNWHISSLWGSYELPDDGVSAPKYAVAFD